MDRGKVAPNVAYAPATNATDPITFAITSVLISAKPVYRQPPRSHRNKWKTISFAASAINSPTPRWRVSSAGIWKSNLSRNDAVTDSAATPPSSDHMILLRQYRSVILIYVLK